MNFGTLIVMVMGSLVGFGGLYMASLASDSGIYLFGLVMFGFAVLFDFWMIKQHFDAAEQT